MKKKIMLAFIAIAVSLNVSAQIQFSESLIPQHYSLTLFISA